MGDTINMVQDGKVYAVPADQVEAAQAQGYRPESAEEHSTRVVGDAREETYGGVTGKIAAGTAGFLRGATLGASDVLLSGLDDANELQTLREVNPTTSIGAEILGGISGTGPAGAVSRLGERIALQGAKSGVAGRAAYSALGTGVEGAVQGGGSYLSSVALEDKPLSAEAFIGAMGKGGLFAGGLGGGLSLSESALLRAKALFPRHEVTREAAEQVERTAHTEMRTLSDDARSMQQSAKQRLDEMRLEQAQVRLSAEQQAASLRVQTEASKLERQQALTERAKNPPTRTRKVFSEDAPVEAAAPPPDAFPATKADVTDGMESTIDAQALMARGVDQLPGVGKDAVKMDKARKAIAEGQNEPIKIAVDSNGKLMLEDGRHRLQAAVEAGKPVKVQWYRGIDAEPPAAGGDDLLAKLQGTKAALDDGKSFNEIAASNPEAAKLADAVKANEQALSEYDAWLSRYGGKKSEVAKFERKQAVTDWADARRSKGPGWVSETTDGNAVLRRGESKAWRGDEAGRKTWEEGVTAKVSPEDRLAADTAIEAAAAGRPRRAVAEEILDGPIEAPTPVDVDEAIDNALRPHNGEHADVSPDLSEAAAVIGKVESTSADLAEALGSTAPAASAERAKQFRAASAAASDSSSAAAAHAADDIQTKLVPEVARSTGKAIDSSMLDRLGDVGAGLEVLKAIGVAVPDPASIPVIGPVLSLYLKGRAAMGVVKRAGGSVPRTAENIIASKAAATRNRVNESVSKILDVSAKVARGSRARAGVAGQLAHQLFPSGEKRASKDSTPHQLYLARMDELARATQPGAIRTAVRERVQTSDPVLQNEIVAAMERKLGFLQGKAPRQMLLPTLLKGDGEWRPSKVQLAIFGRYVQAAEDPASVLEDVAQGDGVSIEAAETLRSVYPSLYREAQMMLLDRAQTMEATLPYTRRLVLSALFEIPVDGTMSPSHIEFLRQGSPAAAPMPAQGSPAPGAPPTPTVSGPMASADRAMTALDRRAGA